MPLNYLAALLLFLTSFVSLSQTQTVTFFPQFHQDSRLDNNLGTAFFYANNQNNVTASNETYYLSSAGYVDDERFRLRFYHPEFLNNKIKSMVLNFEAMSLASNGGANARVTVINSSFNAPWSGFLSATDAENIFYSIETGSTTTDGNIGTNNNSSFSSESQFIYNDNSTPFLESTLAFHNQNSNYIDLGFMAGASKLSLRNISLTIVYECDPPAVPNGLSASNITSNSALISWSAVQGAIEYDVIQNGNVIATTSNTNYALSNLPGQSQVNVSVRARSLCTTGSQSATYSFTTCIQPVFSLSQDYANSSTTSVFLTWSGLVGAEKRVYQGNTLLGSTTNDFYEISGLTPGNNYNFNVQQIGSACNSPLASVNTVTAPATPMGLSVTANNPNELTLWWTPTAGATSYEVYDCNTNTLITTVATNAATISGLASGTLYEYYIVGTNLAGSSAPSNCMSGTTFLETPVVSADFVQNSFVVFGWASIPNATYYEVYNCANALVATTTSLNYSFTGLSSSELVSCRVRAFSPANQSGYSNCAETMTIPDVPNGLQVNQVSTNSIELTWNVPINPNASIEIWRGNGQTLYGTSTGGSFLIQNLMSNTNYDFKIRQVNQYSVSQFSSIVSGTTLLDDPTNLIASTVSETQVSLTWSPVSGATFYTVSDCSGTSIASILNTNYTVSGLASGTLHEFKIQAQSSTNNSKWSNCADAYTQPSAPFITVNSITGTGANISWAAVTGAGSYQIFHCNGLYVGSTTGTSYTITGLSPTTTYQFRVRATLIPAAGATQTGSINSNYSNCLTVRTRRLGGGSSSGRMAGDDNVIMKTQVYPNPFDQQISIEIDSEITEVSISDVNGKIVFISSDIENGLVNTSDIPTGVYILQIVTLDGIVHKKMIKN